jgi:hypothetical protein
MKIEKTKPETRLKEKNVYFVKETRRRCKVDENEVLR